MSDWLASPVIVRTVRATVAGAGFAYPSWRFDGVNVIRHASLRNSLAADAASAITLQDGGLGFNLQRNYVQLASGVTNNRESLTWQAAGAGRELTGVWWLCGAVELAGAGFAELQVTYNYVLETGPTRLNRLERWVKRAPVYR